MTKTEQQRAFKNFEYFLVNYWLVMSHCHRVETIKPHNFQWQITRMLTRIKEALINTARKMGITTMLTAYSAWMLLSKPGSTVVVTSVSDLIAGEFLDKLIYSYKRLPEELQVPISDKTPFSILFENGSKLLIIHPNTEYLDESVDIAIIDNADFISNLPNIQQVLRESLKPSGRLLTVSTLYHNSEFLRQCLEARDGLSDVEYLEIPATIVPGREGKWLENKIKKSSPEKARVDTSPFYLLEGDELVHIDNLSEDLIEEEWED